MSESPSTAVLWYAKDPRIVQPLSAIAEMASMLDMQTELQANEIFEKTRDTTVLADASLKGIINKASASKHTLSIINHADTVLNIAENTLFTDSSGFNHFSLSAVSVPAKGTATVEVVQEYRHENIHTVTESKPFYKIKLDKTEGDRALSSIEVYSENGTPWNYHYRFTNTAVGEKSFHVEMDEYQNTFIVFGINNVAGIQPEIADKIRIVVSETNGELNLKQGSPFVLDNTDTTISLLSQSVKGSNPFSIQTLREMTKYPSVYDDSAVYLGEYDRLVRRHFDSSVSFLSIWNEAVEEKTRGANVDNINTVFYSVKPIAGIALAGLKAKIKEKILYANDALKVKFVAPVVNNYQISITIEIARVYPSDTVSSQIKSLIVSEYGEGSIKSKYNQSAPNNAQLVSFLKSKIDALKDSRANITIAITGLNAVPEAMQLVALNDVSVTVAPSNLANSAWGR